MDANGSVLLDAIEFNGAFSQIDIMYDLAFLLMDVDYQVEKRRATVLMNRYLDHAVMQRAWWRHRFSRWFAPQSTLMSALRRQSTTRTRWQRPNCGITHRAISNGYLPVFSPLLHD
jgi:aminoglycoside/choline kinase family phosphotransferase